MNEMVNKLLLAGNKFISEMHLKKPVFTYTACGPFTKNKERIKILSKQKIKALFAKINLIRHGFSPIWLMGILKI